MVHPMQTIPAGTVANYGTISLKRFAQRVNKNRPEASTPKQITFSKDLTLTHFPGHACIKKKIADLLAVDRGIRTVTEIFRRQFRVHVRFAAHLDECVWLLRAVDEY